MWARPSAPSAISTSSRAIRTAPTASRGIRGLPRPASNARPATDPLYSPETPDFTGDVLSGPLFSIKASLTTLGTWNRSTSLFGVSGSAVSSKLEEFRDLKDGVNAGLEAHARKEDAYLDVVGRHLGLADQDLTVEGGRAGVVDLKLSYDETPHNYAFGARSLYSGVGTASLTISDRIQADLQNSSSPPDAVRKLADYPRAGARTHRRRASSAHDEGREGG